MTADRTSVLVVEDEALVRMGIAEHLRDEGFDVLEAANADEAIQMLIEHSEIRVMFTDIDMPGSMDGLKLAAAVSDRWPPVKIMVTSGHRTVQPSDMPDEAQFFAKPYSMDEVTAAMKLAA